MHFCEIFFFFCFFIDRDEYPAILTSWLVNNAHVYRWNLNIVIDNCGYWLLFLGNVASNEQNLSMTATVDCQLNEEPSHSKKLLDKGTWEYRMLPLTRIKVVNAFLYAYMELLFPTYYCILRARQTFNWYPAQQQEKKDNN